MVKSLERFRALAPSVFWCVLLLYPGNVLAQQIEIRVEDEVAPPGGVAQIRVGLTEPEPISDGKTRLRYSRAVRSLLSLETDVSESHILGTATKVDVLSSLARVFGTAEIGPDSVLVEINSPEAVLGTEGDLPLMVFEIPVSPDAESGESLDLLLELSDSFFVDPQGQPYSFGLKPGVFTVGGVSITDMMPNRGHVPAGATIILTGVGFQAGADVRIEGADVDTVTVVNSTEIHVMLETGLEVQNTTRVRLRNPDDSEDFYYPINELPEQIEPSDTVDFVSLNGKVIVGSAEDILLEFDAQTDSSISLSSSDPTVLSFGQSVPVSGSGIQPVRVFGLREGLVELTARLGESESRSSIEIVGGRVFSVPMLQGASLTRLGLAITNRSETAADVRLRGYPAGGQSEGVLETSLTLFPLEQTAKFLDEFDVSFGQLDGWLEVSSMSGGVHTQFINVPDSIVRYPGSAGAVKQFEEYILPFLEFEPVGIYELAIVNNQDTPGTVDLEWVSENGFGLDSRQRVIPNQGSLSLNLQELFETPGSSLPGTYLRVRSDQPVAAYGQMSSTPLIHGSQPDSPLPGKTDFFLPQFAMGAGWDTYLQMINPTDDSSSVSLRLIREGADDLISQSIVVGPAEMKTLRASDLFFSDPSTLTSGSLVVEASTELAVTALFVRQNGIGVATLLPVYRDPFQEAVFAQVANGPLGSMNLFTGVALLNPGNESVQVSLEILSADGTLTGSHRIELLPGARLARLLSELIDGLGTQFGGHVSFTASQPVYLVQIFGDSELSFLSTIPASPVGQ